MYQATSASVLHFNFLLLSLSHPVYLISLYISLSYVFMHEKAYQTRDSSIESSVMTKVKGFGIYNNHVMDVADYVTPTQVT